MRPHPALACSLFLGLTLQAGLPKEKTAYQAAIEWAQEPIQKWSNRLQPTMPPTGNAFLAIYTQALAPQAWSAVSIHETQVTFIQTDILDPTVQLALLHLAEPQASAEALENEIVYARSEFTLGRISRGAPLALSMTGPPGAPRDPEIDAFLNILSRAPVPFAPGAVRLTILDGDNMHFEDRWGRTPTFTFDTHGLTEDPEHNAKWGQPKEAALKLMDHLHAGWSAKQSSDHYRQILASIHVLPIQGPAWFQVAVEEAWPGLVQELLDRGLDPRKAGPDGVVPLVAACALKDDVLFEAIVHRWGSPLESFHPDPTTYDSPLLAAVRSGLPSRVHRLVSLGANPNEAFAEMTPLELAIQANSLPMVQTLLNAGARVTDEAMAFARETQTPGILNALNDERARLSKARP